MNIPGKTPQKELLEGIHAKKTKQKNETKKWSRKIETEKNRKVEKQSASPYFRFEKYFINCTRS